MIVKIYNPLDKGWIWLDGVRDAQVSYKYAPHIYENGDDLIYLVARINDLRSNHGLRKNTSVICLYDVCLIDPEWTTTNILEPSSCRSKYMTEDVYGCTVLTITFEDDKKVVYALPADKQVYLLNNEGKTIEHL
jgi:hypothetical protein